MIENVAAVEHHDDGKTLELIIEELQQSQFYNVRKKVVNTIEQGLPHNRPRMYIVGILKEMDNGSLSFLKYPMMQNVESG